MEQSSSYSAYLISIHALLAESDHRGQNPAPPTGTISIHALLAESDMMFFNYAHSGCISIHALLAESDCKVMHIHAEIPNFYPRSPCGERRRAGRGHVVSRQFLSTLSLRRATCFRIPYWFKVTISIHALLAESDDAWGKQLRAPHAFLSTLSLRRATLQASTKTSAQIDFYPRSPCGERLDVNGVQG